MRTFLCVVCLWAIPAASAPVPIPDVHFVVVRLDLQTNQIKGYYEFSQPYRKALQPEGSFTAGDVFVHTVSPGDFGYTEVVSRLTGQTILRATTIWSGSGHFEFPGPALLQTGFNPSLTVPDPDSVIQIPLFGSTPSALMAAWSAVHTTDILGRLAAHGPFEVVVLDHFYSVGVSNPATAERFVIAFSLPLTPANVGCVRLPWPRRWITMGTGTAAELEIHNFGDRAVDLQARLRVNLQGGSVAEHLVQVQGLPPDSSRLVVFPPFVVHTTDSVIIDVDVVGSNGLPWEDVFPDDNGLRLSVLVTPDPVFRSLSSIRHPGNIPTAGEALDFDGDGDYDVFQYGTTPRLWENDGTGDFQDVRARSGLLLAAHPRRIYCQEFTGDGHPDLLVLYFGAAPRFFAGTKEGIFHDSTESAGFGGVTGYFDAGVLDLENDGDRDLILQSYTQEPVLINDGLGHFSPAPAAAGITDPGQTSSVTCADLNGDVYTDVILTNWGSPPKVFLNSGSGTFSLLPGPWGFLYGRKSAVCDVDNDGLKDLIFARGNGDDKTLVYRNLGALQFSNATGVGEQLPRSFDIDVADVDRNNFPDLLLDDLDSFTLLLNHGGRFEDRSELIVAMEEEFQSGALGGSPNGVFIDFDGDGDTDIFSQQGFWDNQGHLADPTGVADDPPARVPPLLLLENYPNPCNARTTFRFTLPDQRRVTIELFNVAGQRVASLLEKDLPAGTHTLSAELRIASGVYVCRMTALGGNQHNEVSRKVILMR